MALIALISAAMYASGGIAASSSPLDFDYRTSGHADVRPSLVFNDGETTFIQPSGRSKLVWVKGGEVEKVGPYIAINGVPDEIELIDDKREVATLRYVGSRQRVMSAIDLGGAISPSGALPTIGWQGLAGDLPQSCGGVQKNETILSVNFDGKEERLTTERESQIATVAKNHQTTHALITAPETGDIDSVRARNEYLASVLTSIGVKPRDIRYARGATLDDATELTLVRATTIECVPGKPIVVNDGKRITVLSQKTDASILLNEIAAAMGLKFSVQGPVRLTPIDYEVFQVPHGVALHRLGATVAPWANVILRNNELVLSFK